MVFSKFVRFCILDFNMFHFRQLKKSFHCAFKGLILVFREEQNFRLQLFLSIIVIVLMLFFSVRAMEAVALILIIMFVLILELLNSIFERFSDLLKPRVHHYVEHIKDIMAAVVLISSMAAVAIGIIIFWPYVQAFF